MLTLIRFFGDHTNLRSEVGDAEHNRELAMLSARLGRLMDVVNDVST